MNNKRNTTDAEKEAIYLDFLIDMPIEEIIEKHGSHYYRINKIIDDKIKESYNKQPKICGYTEDSIFELFEAGVKLSELSELLDVPRQIIDDIIMRFMRNYKVMIFTLIYESKL